MKEIYHKYLIFGFALIIGVGVGYMLGFTRGISFIVEKGVNFMNSQGVDFTIPINQIVKVIEKYMGELIFVSGWTG